MLKDFLIQPAEWTPITTNTKTPENSLISTHKATAEALTPRQAEAARVAMSARVCFVQTAAVSVWVETSSVVADIRY